MAIAEICVCAQTVILVRPSWRFCARFSRSSTTGNSRRDYRGTCLQSRGAMASRELSRSLWRAFDALGSRPLPQCQRTIRQAQRSLHPQMMQRCMSTTATRQAEVTEEELREPFKAAPEFDFDGSRGIGEEGEKKNLLRTLRVVPASPSYFSAKPTFTDDFLSLSALLRKVATLPVIPPAEAPKVAWKTIEQYRIMTNEPVKTARYHRMLHILRRLNCIHPSLMPDEVVQAMQRYKKPVQPGDIKPKPGVIDEQGRAKGVGRRKTSSAVAWLVEGEGEVLVNGKSLSQFFGRLHHRESAVWALKATQRLDKYNVFALVQGGGLTGQAEAMTLAVAKSLLVHEPALKPALRRGELFSIIILIRAVSWQKCFSGHFMNMASAGVVPNAFRLCHSLCQKKRPKPLGMLRMRFQNTIANHFFLAGTITRDPRKVERKKPGHVKARKMPTWVKR
jgi:small subunit ribosomal protein S9